MLLALLLRPPTLFWVLRGLGEREREREMLGRFGLDGVVVERERERPSLCTRIHGTVLREREQEREREGEVSE